MGTWSDPTSSGFLGGYGAAMDPLNIGGRPGGGTWSTGADVAGANQEQGGKKNTPAPPDYMGLANQMGDISQRNIEAQTAANRPDMNTPWGSTDWTKGADGTWTGNVSLSPEQQSIFDQQQSLQAGRTGLANTLLGSASDTLGTQADWSGLPAIGSGMEARNRAEDAIYGRASSRLDPMWQQREDATRTRLYNQGLREGDAAYDTAMGNMGRERTDAYSQAMNSAIAGGGTEMSRQFGQDLQGRQQSIAEILQQRGSTLNELQALLSGQQVGMPQMPGFMGAGQAQTPNLLGAAGQTYGAGLDAYNAQQAQTQGLMQGGMSLLPFLLSDERLKTDIRRLPIEALPGVPYASWKWKAGGHGFGVIAQDLEKVRPDLVVRGADGYLRVNYDGIGS